MVGKSEVDGDPVMNFDGGIRNVSRTRYQKSFRIFSELVAGGEIGWLVVAAGRKGDYIRVSPDGVDWSDLVNSLGSTAITEWQGWLVSEFGINSDANSRSAILRCLGVHTAYVNGVPIVGDVYRRDHFRFSVPSTKGLYEVRSLRTCFLTSHNNCFRLIIVIVNYIFGVRYIYMFVVTLPILKINSITY